MKRFTKKALPLAVAAAMVPGFASAAEVSGFADVFYNISSDSAPTTDSSFSAAGEIDITAAPADGVTVRMDVDVPLVTSCTSTSTSTSIDDLQGNPDSVTTETNTNTTCNTVQLEQAYFAWGVTEGITVLGGVFNNPIGAEAEDAPDINFNSSGVVYNILNNQTALYGDNIAGLAGAFAAGPATITVAFLNDIGGVAEENSVALVVNTSPMEGLDLELGYVTQNAGAEDVANINLTFSGVENLSVGFDYLVPSEIIDSAYEVFALYNFGAIGVGARIEEVSYAAGDSNSRTTLRLSYQVASNLTAAIDITDGTTDVANASTVDGIATDGVTNLELIATF